MSILLMTDVGYYIYIFGIVNADLSTVTGLQNPYAQMNQKGCFSDQVYINAVNDFNNTLASTPKKIFIQLVILFAVYGIRNLLYIFTILLHIRAQRVKSKSAKKSICGDLYSICCICFAISGEE
jgi:hypothetical protein